MNKAELHSLIDRYFEGMTSIDDERRLRRELSAGNVGDDPVADEARAVMGLSLAAPVRSEGEKRGPAAAFWRHAAAVAVGVATVGASALWVAGNVGDDECIAYLNGRKIAGSDAAMELMMNDLSLMGDVSGDMESDVAGDLSLISSILD